MEEVIDVAGTGEDAGDREPPAQLVVGETVTPCEAECRQVVEERECEVRPSAQAWVQGGIGVHKVGPRDKHERGRSPGAAERTANRKPPQPQHDTSPSLTSKD